MNFKQIIIALLFLGLPLTATRAETLEQAWSVALSSDQGLQAVKSQTQAAAASVSAAKARRLPTVDVDAAFTQLDDTPGLDLSALGLTLPDAVSHDNFLAASAQVNLPLYTGGQISNGISAASAALAGSRDQEMAAVQNLKLAVADAFVLVLRATHASTLQAPMLILSRRMQRMSKITSTKGWCRRMICLPFRCRWRMHSRRRCRQKMVWISRKQLTTGSWGVHWTQR